ncbi:hypothetical protein H8B09_10445 [Paenibacillus sp. PR3]|uniref:Polymer-forming cytoskeletal protein n=1 Tax=Paenibacillus terricola TaxID=2763503 RepID=A0ABR8MYA6_9BACL|nr:hypothetical protein [Paenibacillus terricola]MBD3919174.1 hypothetical protein [Paenibacillus terricola]
MKKLAFVGSFILLLFLLATPAHTSAASVFEHQNTVIPADQTVDDVYVVGGDTEIEGHVAGIVVVINGNLHLANTARIDGMIVVVGGTVDQEPGVIIGDDVYNLSLDGPTQTSLLIGGGLTVGLWIIQLGIVILLILIPTLIGLLGSKKMTIFINRFSAASWGRLLYIGILSGLALAAISALLVITIIGIPILIVVLLGFLVSVCIGLTVISYRVGELIRPSEGKPVWFKVMMGSILIAAVISIPIIGWIVLLLIALLSLGVCVDWLAAKRKKVKVPQA